MSAVSEALTEVQAALAAIAPAHEGFRDYADLNRGEGGLLSETQAEVSKIILEYDQRRDALKKVETALLALIEDGHPEIPVTPIPELAYEDLKRNFETVQAALAQVKPNTTAAGLGLTSSPPQPK
jgi:hypothetical protein